MTAVETLQAPKTRRLTVSPSRIEVDEPEETNLEWYRRWCREVNENRKKAGLPEDDPITMEEIVAMCKEIRAERYEEEQRIANSR